MDKYNLPYGRGSYGNTLELVGMRKYPRARKQYIWLNTHLCKTLANDSPSWPDEGSPKRLGLTMATQGQGWHRRLHLQATTARRHHRLR